MKKETVKKAAPKKAEPIELTKAVLLAAAKDINKADIADPPIDIKGSESQLKKALLSASEIVEPEDELKPETFAVLKAVAEEDPEDEDEGNEEDMDADEDTDEEVEDDEAGAEESSLEDLTVEELQAKCKTFGIPFKAKKTTKAQLISALEAYEAEQEEDEDEDEDEPESEAKPEKKAATSKPAAPAKAEKKGPRDFSKSNKATVWKSWKEGKGETDPKKLHALVPDIKESTVSGWLKMWAKGNGLPAIANKK